MNKYLKYFHNEILFHWDILNIYIILDSVIQHVILYMYVLWIICFCKWKNNPETWTSKLVNDLPEITEVVKGKIGSS